MAELTYREAVADGIAQEMERDETVVFLGFWNNWNSPTISMTITPHIIKFFIFMSS